MAVSKVRTPEELKNQDLNYFIAFDIEPTETNVKKIEEALNNKRKTFARVVTPLTTRLTELKDDIDQILLQDATYGTDATGAPSYTPKSGGRKKEADAAKKFYANRAIEMAQTLCQSGYIEDTKIDEIAKRFFVTQKEILDGIAGLLSQGVVLKKVAGVKREVAFSNFKKIEAYLRTINKRDLYDFSELPDNATTKQLYDKQEEIYSVYSKKANDAKGKAAMDLSGIGKVVFKSDTARKEYDVYYKSKTKVWDQLSTLYDSGIKVINDTFFIKCLDALRGDVGLSVDEAEKELYAYMDYFKLTRESSEKMKIELCPYDDCKKPYVVKKDMKTCPNCGRSLELKCWNCGALMLFTSNAQACPKCGITKNNQTEFDTAQKAFATLLKTPNVSEIDLAKALNRMENVYPAYDKFATSFVGKAIASAKAQIDQKKKDAEKRNALYEKYVKELNALMAKKEFCHAEELLKKLKNEDPTYDTKVLDNQIGTALKSAQQYVDTANRFLKANNEDAAVENASKALGICTDYVAAKQVLKNFPPKAPRNLTGKVFRNTVKLDWQTEGDQNAITYTVLRKIGSAPANDQDGEVLEKDLTINFYEDSGVISATAYYYAVFAVRGEVCSAIAVTPAPVVMFLDVYNLHQEKTESSIKATWAVPDNVTGVEVYRKGGVIAPAGRGDGDKISTIGMTAFDDTAIKEEKNSYLIVCKYNYLGKEHYSAGIKASYRKFRMPVSIKNAKVEAAGVTDFYFTCDEPQNGNVKLYVSDRRLDLPFHEVDDKANFLKKCKNLKELDAALMSETKFYFTVPERKMLWLYPVNANEQLYVVSEPILVNTLVGIESVNVINKNGNVTIEGVLDPKVRNVIAVINEQKFVQSVDDPGDHRICAYDAFIKDNGFYLSLKPGTYYITLFAEFIEGGNKLYSRATPLPEVIDNREKAIVKYALTYTPSVSGPYKVKIDFYSDEQVDVPAVDLVSGFPKPLNKNSGVVQATFEGGPLKVKKSFFSKKPGFWLSAEMKVGSAANMREKIVLFLHSEADRRIQLKEVQSL